MGFNTGIEWYNRNKYRRYPFRDDATLTGADGVVMRTEFIVDMSLHVPTSTEGIYVQSVYISDYAISVTVSSNESSLLVGTYTRKNVTPFRTYPLDPLQPNVSGNIVFSDSLDNRHFRFNSALQSGIDPAVIRYIDPPEVSCFYQDKGPHRVEADNIVRLVPGNMFYVIHEEGKIVVGLKEGYRKQFLGKCDNSDSFDAPALTSINGVKADSNGKITVVFK